MTYNRNYRRNKNKNRVTNINVTPLVDVLLVLITIFMIAAPVITVGVKVDLPKTKAATMSEEASPMIISIDKNSRIFIEDAEVSVEELISKIPFILKTGKTEAIYVRGDKNLQYGQIMKIMGIISSAGGCKVSLVSDIDKDSQEAEQRVAKKRDNH